MSGLVLPGYLAQMPLSGARIERRNGITDQLKVAIVGNYDMVDCALAMNVAIARTGGFQGTAQGLGYNHTDQTTIPSWPNTPALSNTGNSTMLLLATFTAQSGVWAGYAGARDAISTPGYWSFGQRADNDMLTWESNGVGPQWTGAPLTAGKALVVLRNVANTTATAWVNGVNLGDQVSGFNTSTNSSTLRLGVARFDAPTENRTGQYHLFLRWSRPLSDTEIASLNANPWQVLQAPPRRFAAQFSANAPIFLMGRGIYVS